MSALADERHSPDVYLSTMQFLLGAMQVDAKRLALHVSHYRESRNSLRQT